MLHRSLPATLRCALLSALVLLAVSITACGRADETPSIDTTPSTTTAGAGLACTPPWTGGIESVPRDSILGWAGGLQFGGNDTARARLYGFPPGADVQVNLVVGPAPEGICWPTGTGCIIARVVTNTAQPDLGLAVGTNYIWADSAGGSARSVTIPANPGAPVIAHRLAHHRYTLGESAPARRGIGPGACMWCGDTCWCFWPTFDTARASILRLRGDTGLVRPGPRP